MTNCSVAVRSASLVSSVCCPGLGTTIVRILTKVPVCVNSPRGSTSQIVLAWLLAPGDDIAPIPGTKRVASVEGNTTADRIALRGEHWRRDRLGHRGVIRHQHG